MQLNFKPICQPATPSPQVRFGNTPPQSLEKKVAALAQKVELENATMGHYRTIANSPLANQLLRYFRQAENHGKGPAEFSIKTLKGSIEGLWQKPFWSDESELELTLEALVITGQLTRWGKPDEPGLYTTRVYR